MLVHTPDIAEAKSHRRYRCERLEVSATKAREDDERDPCAKRPNDPSSATRPTGRVDGNSDAMAGFAAAHG